MNSRVAFPLLGIIFKITKETLIKLIRKYISEIRK